MLFVSTGAWPKIDPLTYLEHYGRAENVLAGTTSVDGAVKIGDYWGYLDGLNVYALAVSNSQLRGSLMMPLRRVAELLIVGLSFAYMGIV